MDPYKEKQKPIPNQGSDIYEKYWKKNKNG
jgi:hypothetical protein